MQVVLAADVLYDDSLSTALCRFLLTYLLAARDVHRTAKQGADSSSASPGRRKSLGSAWPCACRRAHGLPLVLLAAEKRRVFTIQAMAVQVPALEHFLATTASPEMQQDGFRLCVHDVSVADIPQSFSYHRGDDLVLLQIELIHAV